jgi:hypothetical protein
MGDRKNLCDLKHRLAAFEASFGREAATAEAFKSEEPFWFSARNDR